MPEQTPQPRRSLAEIIAKVQAEVPYEFGRPTKISRELTEKVCGALVIGSTRRDAAQFNGITYRTFLNWIELGEKEEEEGTEGDFFHFFHAVCQAESEFALRMTKVVTDAAIKDPKYALEWLKRRRRAEWGDSLRISDLTNDQVIELLEGQAP